MSCCGCCAKNAWVLPKEMPPAVVEHMSKGKFVELKDHTKIFVRDEGGAACDGDTTTIVMIHGVPASSFLYRKLFDPLVEQGYRVVAMDLPGLGLSDKPIGDDYSWPVLAEKLGEILEHSDLQLFSSSSSSSSHQDKKIHLVIHDIGGPIAALWAATNIDKVLSMTVLDTPLDLETFRKPFPMNMFPIPIVGSIALATMTPWVLRHFMYLRGVSDVSACNHEESVAWAWLLFHKQGNASFRKIMKSFPSTAEQRKSLTRTIRQSLGSTTSSSSSAIPMQIVWAQGEVAIPKYQCDYIRDNFNVGHVHEVPGRHFFQLESAPLIAEKITNFLKSS